MELRNRKQLHRAKVSTSWKPESLHALTGECDSGVPESKTMAGNSIVHIGTWENRIVPCESFQQAEEARRKYGDAVVGLIHSRGVNWVTITVLMVLFPPWTPSYEVHIAYDPNKHRIPIFYPQLINKTLNLNHL